MIQPRAPKRVPPLLFPEGAPRIGFHRSRSTTPRDAEKDPPDTAEEGRVRGNPQIPSSRSWGMLLHSERNRPPPERARRASANMPARIRSRHTQRLAIAMARSCARGECGERGFAFPRKTLTPSLPQAHGLTTAAI